MTMEGDEERPPYGEHSSPDLEKYVQPLPIPGERTPDGTHRGADYHEIPIEETTHEFHPGLGGTTIWGFDGQFPGPILSTWRNRRLAVEVDNSGLPDEHLFAVDERIGGTTSANYVDYDGPVPEVRTVTHFHGLNVAPEADGQADMWTSPGGVEGPQFDGAVQVLPNRQSRLTSTYHDHTRGITRLNNYAGLVGPYYIENPFEKILNLPEDEYDVPLVLADRSFTDDGELYYPETFVANVAGDVATVNGAAWPYLEVEPRRYRFRIINVSNARTYDLGFVEGEPEEDDGGHHDGDDDHHADVPTLYQLSAGHGFLEEVVEIGPHGEMESLVVAPFERAEVVVDFSEYAGETFTVTNDAAFPYAGGADHDGHDGGHDVGGASEDDVDHGSDHPHIGEIMQFRVTDSASSRDTSTHPSDLWLPNRRGPDPDDAETTRRVTMQMGMDDEGLMVHTLNGKRWGDPTEFRPELGSTEIWKLENGDDHTHPIHLHLVAFDVIGRGADGTHPPHPNERGGKDVVRVDPGETVRIAVTFDGHTGKFPFHCHVLEHEEHDMMRTFEVVEGDDPGNGRGPWDGDGPWDWIGFW